LLLASLRPAYATENIFGSDYSDILLGTSGIDEIFGGYGDDVLTGNDGNDLLHGGNGDDILRGGNGDDVLRGGDGDDELRGGNGDDMLYGEAGVDRLYGGLGADRFVFEIGAEETDEVMDFNPGQNDTVWLQGNYSEYTHTADSIRIDNEGDLEIRLGHENWSRVVRLNNNNLDLDVEELTEGLQLHFSRRF
jgi:Ca2+-binding RTX toxin-like protein